ncbi:MAG: hypothetical protein DRN78_02715 [Thermoproteota archaeon]|nr:MAG: hypothetical protein DRN78_02715 [Candidatus Korarchaeota archaeon]
MRKEQHVVVSHTGKIVAKHELAVSALRQAGALVVDSFSEIYASVKSIVKQPIPKGGWSW